MPTTVIAGSGSTATPVTIANTYQVGITPLTASAIFDGTSAAGAFIPCLSFYSQDGRLMGRYKGEETVAAGDTSQQTFAPFLGRGVTESAVSQLQLFDFTVSSAVNSVSTSGTDLGGGVVLEIWAITRVDEAVGGPNMSIRFNGDTGANYDYDWVRNVEGVVGPVDGHASSAGQAAQAGSGYAANVFSVNRVTVPNYDLVTTGVYKVGEFTGYVGDTSTAAAGAGIRAYAGGLMWRNTARITSVSWTCNPGKLFQVGSRFLVLRR